MSEPSSASRTDLPAGVTSAADSRQTASDPVQSVTPPSPEKDEPPSPIAKGAKWGSIVGFIIAQLVIQQNSPLGFYTGDINMLLLFAICIGLGAAIGGGFGWLNMQPTDDDNRFPG